MKLTWAHASLLQRAHQIEIKQRLEEFAKRERVHKIKVHHFHPNSGVLPTSKAFIQYHLLMILFIDSLSVAKLHFTLNVWTHLHVFLYLKDKVHHRELEMHFSLTSQRSNTWTSLL